MRVPGPCAAVALLTSIILPAAAQEVPTFQTPGEVRAGGLGLVEGDGMSYFLRVPESYGPGSRLIVFLHGSNMNGLDYVRSFDHRGWCVDDVLVCPNGEQGHDPLGERNFTFESAKLVAGIVESVQGAFEVARTYVGGHSQGAFMTYSVAMHYPERVQGLFPIAGGCWAQNEPNLWDNDPKTLARQRQIAIAVIHGKADPVVDFSYGRHAFDKFRVMGYPKLRVFAPDELGHELMLAPVPKALEWLDAMTGDDVDLSLRAAQASAKAGVWSDAIPAAGRVLRNTKKTDRRRRRARAVLKKAEKSAHKAQKRVKQAIATAAPEVWLPQWYAFRHAFGLTDTARALVAHMDTKRRVQAFRGSELFDDANAWTSAGRKKENREALQQLLREAPYSYYAYYAVTRLSAGP